MARKILATLVMLAIIVGGAIIAIERTEKSGHTNDGKLAVTASYYPLYDFARHVGGDKVNVVNMTPAGAEPHDFEPSPQSLIDAHSSAVFIYNGGPLEPWVDSFLSDYKHTVIKADKGIELLPANHSHEYDYLKGATTDPHFWLDPVLAEQIVATVRDGLSAADPGNEAYYTANAKEYTAKLSKLNRDFAEGLSRCTLDTAISSHGAFSYLAKRYSFSVVPIAGIEPEDEPSPAKMAEITNIVRQKGIKFIFFESLVSPRLAETIASEAGAATLVFDPIEGMSKEDQNKGKDYISVQHDNLANLRKALECR